MTYAEKKLDSGWFFVVLSTLDPISEKICKTYLTQADHLENSANTLKKPNIDMIEISSPPESSQYWEGLCRYLSVLQEGFFNF
jgi:hypothetical protein